jgi:hypothetical protein
LADGTHKQKRYISKTFREHTPVPDFLTAGMILKPTRLNPGGNDLLNKLKYLLFLLNFIVYYTVGKKVRALLLI